MHGIENKKNYFLSEIRSKKRGHLFLDFILLFNIAVEKFGKKVIWSSWSSRKRFLSPEYPDFGSKC